MITNQNLVLLWIKKLIRRNIVISFSQIIIHHGKLLDLFVVLPPAEWGVIYLLRTGSGTFSKRFVTKIKPKFRINEGHLEELKTISDLLGKRQVYIPVKTPTEKSVFKTVGWNYFPPEERIE